MADAGIAAPPTFVRLAAHPVRWRVLTELARGDRRVRELVALIREPQNVVSYHLRLLRDGGLVTARRSSADSRDSYYRLDLDRCAEALRSSGSAIHPALLPSGPGRSEETREFGTASVLFACTGNSARSPIAEALLRARTGPHLEIVSAGSHPKPRLHPLAVRVLAGEYEIDISEQRPQHLDAFMGRRFDHVITLCDRVREVCPEFGESARRVHWSVPDPATVDDPDQPSYPAFVRTAAEIDTRVRHLIATLTLEEVPQ